MRVSRCGLTVSSQLLKYVASNYWNMYVTSAPRNSFTPPAAWKHQHQQIYDNAVTSNCQGTQPTPGGQTRLILSPLLSIRMKIPELWDMDRPRMRELDRGAFCMLGRSADWSLAPAWRALDLPAQKQIVLNDWTSCHFPRVPTVEELLDTLK